MYDRAYRRESELAFLPISIGNRAGLDAQMAHHAIVLDVHRDYFVCVLVDVVDHVGAVVYPFAVEGDDSIPGSETGFLRGAAGEHGLNDVRIASGYPKDHTDVRKDQDGQYDVENRTGGDDHEASPNALVLKIPRIRRTVVGRILARHLAIPAQRQGVHAVSRVAAPHGKERGAKAKGEIGDPHAGSFREHEMAEFVEDDEHAEQRQENEHMLDVSQHLRQRDHRNDCVDYHLYGLNFGWRRRSCRV